MDSILRSIKKMLGLYADDTSFDIDVIININSVLMGLSQLGIGPKDGFLITGYDEKWSDLIGGRVDLEPIKTLVYLKVRILFDPPSTSFVLESMERQIREFEWRLHIQVESTQVI